MRSLVVLAGVSFGVLVLMLAGPRAPLDHIGKIPIPDSLGSATQVRSAEAWYYTTVLCDSSFHIGDWIQHFYDSKGHHRGAHRSTKVGHKQVRHGTIFLKISRDDVHYVKRGDHFTVTSKKHVGLTDVVCGRT